ncbi:MAG: hypothetical protein EB039_14395 [Proteobacteria bacterium]|nr:hypothetical protein [Pseudomonadota bacterium]
MGRVLDRGHEFDLPDLHPGLDDPGRTSHPHRPLPGHGWCHCTGIAIRGDDPWARTLGSLVRSCGCVRSLHDARWITGPRGGLVLPKPVILHLVVSRMDTSGWGDALFGVAVFAFLASPTPMDAVAFVGLSLIAATIFVSYAIAVNSLAFWTGRAETLSDQLIFGLITFATYPEKLFTGAVKVVLYTVVPAGFVAYIPVSLLHEWDRGWALVLLVGTIGSISVAVTTFTVGLRRYQSGNLTAMRA